MFLLALLFGCPENVDYSVGVGSIYTSRCSAEMSANGREYRAECEPPACEPRFRDAGVSHVVVAVNPGVSVLGYAERVCLSDLETMMSTPAP